MTKQRARRKPIAKVLVRVRQRKRMSLEDIEVALRTLAADHPAALAVEDWLDHALDGEVSRAVGVMSDAELRSWKGGISVLLQMKQHFEMMRDLSSVKRVASGQ